MSKTNRRARRQTSSAWEVADAQDPAAAHAAAMVADKATVVVTSAAAPAAEVEGIAADATAEVETAITAALTGDPRYLEGLVTEGQEAQKGLLDFLRERLPDDEFARAKALANSFGEKVSMVTMVVTGVEAAKAASAEAAKAAQKAPSVTAACPEDHEDTAPASIWEGGATLAPVAGVSETRTSRTKQTKKAAKAALKAEALEHQVFGFQ